MTNRLILNILLAVIATVAWVPQMQAFNLDSVQIEARAGYSLGGTTPLEFPATIRKLNSYRPCLSGMIGVTAAVPVANRWWVQSGLRLERYAMDVDARLKNYEIEVTRGGEMLEGIFLGDVRVKVAQTQLTLPVLAGYDLSPKWRLRAGAYMSVLLGRSFTGWAHNGYMRADEPTGAKVTLGDEPSERGDYDFDDRMRTFQWGLDVGADYRFAERWGAFAELTYGVNGLLQKDFSTVPMKLHPLYATLGVIYKLK